MVNILYDSQCLSNNAIVGGYVESIERSHGIPINIEFSNIEWTIERKLAKNPDYDLVILHLGGDFRDAFRLSPSCRKLVGAKTKIVAESTSFPYGMDEVLMHFDHYTEPLFFKGSLKELLKHYEFIS